MAISDKLTYLNETKTLLKNKINLTGANITTDTFRQYPTKLQNALLDVWNNEGEPIFTNWGTKVNGEGTNVKLDNTINARMKLTPKGNTSQTGTPTPSSPIPVNVVSGDNEVVVCGKNLFDKDSCTTQVGYFSSNGAVNSGGSSTITTSYTRILPNTQMYLGGGTSTIENVCYYDKDKNFIERTTSNPRSINKNAYYIRFQITTSSLNLNTLQLEVGSTATTYEPYTSQNYPLYLGVENLFDGEIELGSIDPANGSLVSNNSRTRSKNYTKVKPNTTYTFKREVGENRWIVGYTSSKVGITDGNFNNKASAIRSIGVNDNIMTFTTTSTTEYIKWYDTNSTDLTENVIIELGSHIQYISDTPIELNKIGTYQDYIYKTDKWYLHKEVGKVVLNGSESWATWYQTSNSNIGFYYYPTNVAKIGTESDYNNALFNDRFSEAQTRYNIYIGTAEGLKQCGGTGTQYFALGIAKTRLSDWSTSTNAINSLKTWLSNNNVVVYYVLDTPTNTEITNTTLINQLESLKGAMSYEGQTNISSGFMIVGASALGELNSSSYELD